MYHPTSRVLTVLELLQSHPQISGPDLAARMEVDVRTVRRYVAMLQDLGIPIRSVVGRQGGYALRPGFKLPPLMFRDEEAMALCLGLLVARRLGLGATAPTIEGVLAKVERVLPDALRERVQALYATLELDVAGPAAVVESVHLGILGLATQRGRRVLLRYASGEGVREREFEPYGVACYGGRWYTAGRCLLRDDLRVFRLDRVRHLALLDAEFAPPQGFDCLAHITRSFADIPDIWDCTVILGTDLALARSAFPASLAVLEEIEGGTLLRSSIDDLDMLARQIARLGCPITVLGPPELRTAFQRLAALLAAA
ncbi:YafY family transcriptional regulator [Chloroflexia bacterium SDU3-3]|nr:YafY family transcriptional regulator [Chloroflexia bacterium SDU3-3]